ncbi:hypothetical protein Pcinc_023182 [Petrolisthes cinctipes]|uniref:Uncharacterized protein n=1 Tax=Petrolisthes cinctipes TaxID=88211 RepID=A0AAE1FCI1_PETCI|nr:hypothetical protein Pcinc_023182 [Petrolisthes cinctipes]
MHHYSPPPSTSSAPTPPSYLVTSTKPYPTHHNTPPLFPGRHYTCSLLPCPLLHLSYPLPAHHYTCPLPSSMTFTPSFLPSSSPICSFLRHQVQFQETS